MKISKEALSFFKDRANDPGGDIHDPITTKDAKIILEALGIVVRPDRVITWLGRITSALPSYTGSTIDRQYAKDLLAYIKKLEGNQK